ncbi:MAG: glycosyltransferase family 4 protein [Vicinamibacterales bacterium]
MAVKTIVVCEAQVPFVEGGAEFHVRELVRHLREAGFEAERVSLPFKWYPKSEILAHAAAWRLIDLSESNGRPIDVAIGTKFPSYFVRHPCKVAWVIHQYRAAYDLCGTPYSDFAHVEEDVGVRQRLIELDRAMLGECRRIFSNAGNTARRLEQFNGVHAAPLYHPPRLADRLQRGDSKGYLLTVGRIEAVKRVDLVVRAMQRVDPAIQLIVVGHGTQRENVERTAHEAGIANRVSFLGAVDDDTLIQLYAGAAGVVYPPFDEDFGYVTLESFLAAKPVVTTVDSGGPLEFVEDGVNGCVCEPTPESLADALSRIIANPAWSKSLGEAGYDKARTITWAGVIERLVGGL